MVSVPPLNYIGRIIVSYTDDTEQKVIAHYGGKSWRRIENFLRGVTDDDPENIPGQKIGEEYVALRESNVPIHAHSETIEEASVTGRQEWSAKDKGGTTRLVNTPQDTDDTSSSINIKNTSYNYQISPLEYAAKGENDLTLPHDNLPPYLRVYIWECTELTDDERKVTEEPGGERIWNVTFLGNGGTPEREQYQRNDGEAVGTAPTVNNAGQVFMGWRSPDGSVKVNETSTNGQPVVIEDIVRCNTFYVAQWKPLRCVVTFDAGEGVPDTMVKEYDYGQTLGYIPTVDQLPDGYDSLDGWFEEDGVTQAREDTLVRGDITYYARYSETPEDNCTVRFFDHEGNELPDLEQVVARGSRIGQLSTHPYER